MIRLLCSLLFLFTSNFCICQSNYPYQDINLEKPSDYKQFEPVALSAATFLLSTPFKKDDVNRSRALQFLTKWMAGTKEYQFKYQDVLQDIADNPDLVGLFIAAMAKFSLENKSVSANYRLVEISSSKLVLAYCDNPANNFKLKKKMRKKFETN